MTYRFSDPPIVVRWICAVGVLFMLSVCVLSAAAAVSSQVTGRAVYGQGFRGYITEKVTKEKDPEKFSQAVGKAWFHAVWSGFMAWVLFYFFRKLE